MKCEKLGPRHLLSNGSTCTATPRSAAGAEAERTELKNRLNLYRQNQVDEFGFWNSIVHTLAVARVGLKSNRDVHALFVERAPAITAAAKESRRATLGGIFLSDWVALTLASAGPLHGIGCDLHLDAARNLLDCLENTSIRDRLPFIGGLCIMEQLDALCVAHYSPALRRAVCCKKGFAKLRSMAKLVRACQPHMELRCRVVEAVVDEALHGAPRRSSVGCMVRTLVRLTHASRDAQTRMVAMPDGRRKRHLSGAARCALQPPLRGDAARRVPRAALAGHPRGVETRAPMALLLTTRRLDCC
jgi:hypothetical protein